MNNEDAVLCACIGLTKGRAQQCLGESPDIDFQEFLRETEAGATCTACMLDLEYFFVETPRSTVAEPSGPSTAVAASGKSFKQRLYQFLDRLPPRLPLNRSNWMPVLAGKGIEQYLWMANHELLYEDGSDISEFTIGFKVRGPDGRIAYMGKERLARSGMLRHNLSQYLDVGDDLTIGSVQVDRHSRAPGVRGTTRPQIEVLTRHAAASLHFQAASPGYNKTVTVPSRPGAERMFLTAINCAKSPLSLEIACGPDGGAIAPFRQEALGPFESRLIELETSELDRRSAQNELVSIHIRSKGLGKLHLMAACHDLSRLSLDHL